MVLEATILIIDNSDWTRNGDYLPNRFQAQISAANFIIENRCETNPENSLGIMTMAGKRVEMVSTLTNDESRLLGSMSNIPLNGECDIYSALSISILCLKHRINKNQKQRIILFVGSPIRTKTENLILIGKKLKKYNVAVDIISFGHVEENREALNAFLKEVNNSNNSSILEVPIGGYIMETLFTSPIMGGNAGMNQMGVDPGAGNAQQNMGGISQFERDMNLAMQMSLQEAQKEQQNNTTNINAEAENKKTNMELEEEQELEKARLLSIQENNKLIQKENEEKEKKTANEILEDKDFLSDLLKEVKLTAEKDERVLVTTLTKRMAEDLTDYYARIGVKVRYMHSEIDTLERIDIVDDLRRGKFDVLVGVNLLREGLDLPEVSLVAILDADKEGFLRNETSLIQTIGRAARNVNGRVIMYVDDMTDSVKNAYDITLKRRKLQMKYNEVHGITPKSTQRTLKEKLAEEDEKYKGIGADVSTMPKDELRLLIKDLEKDMKDAAARLDFERAADLRNKLYALKGFDK